jgi:hypothetical protein
MYITHAQAHTRLDFKGTIAKKRDLNASIAICFFKKGFLNYKSINESLRGTARDSVFNELDSA